jgi:hypothetical protein
MMDKCLELEAYKMAREQAKEKVYTPPELREIEERVKMNKVVEQTYNDFWKEIVENEDGTINIEQVKKELSDYYFLLQQVPAVYSAVTNGTLSKTTYNAETVITEYEDCLNENYIMKDDLRDIMKTTEDGASFIDEIRELLEE